MIGNQHAAKCRNVRMRVGECVDAPVLHDSLANAGSELIAQRSFDEIAGEIADQ